MRVKIFFLTVVSLTLVSCIWGKNSGQIEQNDLKMEKDSLEMKDKIYYMFGHSAVQFGEVRINDMVCTIDYQDVLPPSSRLTHYMLPNQKQRLDFKMFVEDYQKGKTYTESDLNSFNRVVGLVRFIINGREFDDERTFIYPTFKVPNTDRPLGYYEFSYEFDLVEELNFTTYDWTSGEDLAKLDKDILLSQVEAKFKQLRDLLNSGKGDLFYNELEVSYKNYHNSRYANDEYRTEFRKNAIETFSEQKGHVLDIDNCFMRIMGDGKVVTLERIDEYKGQGALMAIDKRKKIVYRNYLMLYMPKGTTELKVIRHESTMRKLK